MNYSYCTWTCVAPIWIISNNLNNICVTDLPGLNTHTHAHRRAYTHTHTAREAGEWYTCTVHGAYQRMLFVYYDNVNVHTPLRSVHPLLYFSIIFKQSIVWNLLTCDYLIDYYPGPIFLSWFYCVYAPQCILAHKSPSAFCSNDKFFFLFFFFSSFYPHNRVRAAEQRGLCYLRCIAVKGSALQWISIG